MMMDPRLAAYGAMHGVVGGKPTGAKVAQDADARKMRAALPVLVGSLFVPWLIFVATLWLRAFDLRYSSSAFADLLCVCLALPVLVFAYMTYNLAKTGDPKPMALLTVTSLVAWIVGFCLGDVIYTSFMRPYFDINNLNTYPNVDPSKYEGSQLMDAGMIQFSKGSALWLQKSIGFKNDDIYCVAPIRSGSNTTQSSYDFWAVGLNCCSGHAPDFRCGEYTNPSARWGLRLMDDQERSMFRLAVQEAEASFNLHAPHPVFLYWMSDPAAEVNAYQTDGFQYFTLGVFSFFAVQLALVVCLGVIFAKI